MQGHLTTIANNMDKYWITPDGSYYVGMFVAEGSIEYPQRPSEMYDPVDGAWIFNLTRAKATRIADLNAIAQQLADVAIADYPKAETLSWPDQAAEASAWCVDNAIATPYMDALALSRGLDRVDYLTRTVAKVTSFKAFSAHVFGTRQKYVDQIDAATDEAELAAIVFNFT